MWELVGGNRSSFDIYHVNIEIACIYRGLALEFFVRREDTKLSRSISQPRTLFGALLIVLDFITVDTADVGGNKSRHTDVLCLVCCCR
jgi:hypothetical protein